mmetsp:Transcript_18073/g.46307  ORF Transcript_18073/g.46307 Transcript_18073/m.46307 type:complete len:297 (-) Transcript_18073:910-1800(-)
MERSKRPGRSSASSSEATRLVAPMTSTLSRRVKPSISCSSWSSPCSRSALPLSPPPSPRALPMASISSMNTIAGALARAVLKRLRTRAAATPWNISTNSAPLALKKGMPASPAIALARYVLPVPGGPSSRMPRGILAPMPAYFWSPIIMVRTSSMSAFTSSMPATSSNDTPVLRVFPSFLSSLLRLKALAGDLEYCSEISCMRSFFFLPNFSTSQVPVLSSDRRTSSPAMGTNCPAYWFSHTHWSEGSITLSSGVTCPSCSSWWCSMRPSAVRWGMFILSARITTPLSQKSPGSST